MFRFSRMQRFAMAGAALALAAALPACTTIEGTNALVDIGTFEREVGRETLKGLGVIDRETKAPIESPRGLLALPKSGAAVSPPGEAPDYSALPEDSDTPKIDSTGLTDADLVRIRKIIVFDGRADSGRKLTNAEIAQLTRNIESGRLRLITDAEAPLWVPDESYFTTKVGGQEAICLAPNGDLVSIDDPACPPEIRQQLASTN
ncbi:MAG: hypothetical protein KKH72_12060 [Alphaproteobacteria bacterium]|nr:hypothetical protein [Alphaproteobacteria bacterium]